MMIDDDDDDDETWIIITSILLMVLTIDLTLFLSAKTASFSSFECNRL